MQPSVKNLKRLELGQLQEIQRDFSWLLYMAKNFCGLSSPKLAEAKALRERLVVGKG
ncbi:hypothetical protein TIFTF001_054022 [Ficus carica]|uniref:Uncharacterized protein n=1 Tax=Ficus carica TaxID=3494 RepID=A0AA88JEE4_FICCA|nr:hypothetical protein TIFTF001_054022 [Ficus carica]